MIWYCHLRLCQTSCAGCLVDRRWRWSRHSCNCPSWPWNNHLTPASAPLRASPCPAADPILANWPWSWQRLSRTIIDSCSLKPLGWPCFAPVLASITWCTRHQNPKQKKASHCSPVLISSNRRVFNFLNCAKLLSQLYSDWKLESVVKRSELGTSRFQKALITVQWSNCFSPCLFLYFCAFAKNVKISVKNRGRTPKMIP